MHREKLEVNTIALSRVERYTLLLSKSKCRIILAPLIFSRHVFLADCVLLISVILVSKGDIRSTKGICPRVRSSRCGYRKRIHQSFRFIAVRPNRQTPLVRELTRCYSISNGLQDYHVSFPAVPPPSGYVGNLGVLAICISFIVRQ